MNLLLNEIRHDSLLWLLALVPVVFAVHKLKPEAHTLLLVDRCHFLSIAEKQLRTSAAKKDSEWAGDRAVRERVHAGGVKATLNAAFFLSGHLPPVRPADLAIGCSGHADTTNSCPTHSASVGDLRGHAG